MTGDDDWSVLGLSADDVAIYQACLRNPSLGAAEVGATLAIPPPAVCEAMSRLAEIGLLRSGDLPSADRVVDPVLAVGRLAGSLRSQLDELELQAGDLRQVFSQGQALTDPTQVFEVCSGAERIAARLSDLIDSAQHDVVFCDAPPYTNQGDRSLNPSEVSALQRGVRMRVLHGQQAYDDPAHVTALEEGIRLGLSTRVSRDLTVKLAIIDGRTAVLPLQFGHEEAGRYAVFVSHAALVAALELLFDLMWRRSAPSVAPAPSAGEDAERLTTIVDLLAAGFTDGAIARHLDISERTLRRRIQRLENRLGACNRFQLALLAHRAGLISSRRPLPHDHGSLP